jgi:mannose-6-phosphate isomerase-like protein (cupin superfamily)
MFSVVRAAERIKFPDTPDAPSPNYFFECLAFNAQDKSIQAYLAEFPQIEPKHAHEHAHDGAEFLFVLAGTLVIRFQDEDYTLAIGDSVYFDASEPHSYRGMNADGARCIVITTPPRP